MSHRPDSMLDRPDHLSILFGGSAIREARATRLELTAPWGFRSRPGQANDINFILVASGGGVIVRGRSARPFRTGDVIMLFDDAEYVLLDQEASPVADCAAVEAKRRGTLIEFGGGGSPTTLLIGSFATTSLHAQAIEALPRFCQVGAGSFTSSIQALLALCVAEIGAVGTGSDALLARVCEMLLITMLRIHPPERGVVAGLVDSKIGRAVQAIYDRPDERWSLHVLARIAGMSRSAFAARFRTIVGLSAYECVTHIRMRSASVLLESDETIASVSQAVGYASEAAFKRAFKRVLGITPGSARRQ